MISGKKNRGGNARLQCGEDPPPDLGFPNRYFDDASSINFARSVKYGFGVLATSLKFLLRKAGVARPAIFLAGPKDQFPESG